MRLARLFETKRLSGERDLLLVVFALMFARGDGAFAVDEVPRSKPPIACPSQDFQKFLEIFAEDEAVQRAFTKTPLITLSMDQDAKPNPIRVMNMLEYRQIKFPVFPSARERAERSLNLHLHGILDDRHADVHTMNPVVAWGITSYFFSKDDCWRLILVNPVAQ
jgi:hypothetical protein